MTRVRSRVAKDNLKYPVFPLSLSLQSHRAAAERKRRVRDGLFRMNNAAMNEAAALCHATVGNYKYKKRGSAGDVRPCSRKLNYIIRHLTLPSPLNPGIT